MTYLRYQDDIIVLCKTKRQLNRCRRRMMEILHEKGLSLSRKKSRMGCINQGFHFLGIYYSPTRTENNIKATHANDDSICSNMADLFLIDRGGKSIDEHQKHEPLIVPHARTIRKAREQVKMMVEDGMSAQKITRYLHRFVLWWVRTSIVWTYDDVLNIFIRSCWDSRVAALAYGLQRNIIEHKTPSLLAPRPEAA